MKHAQVTVFLLLALLPSFADCAPYQIEGEDSGLDPFTPGCLELSRKDDCDPSVTMVGDLCISPNSPILAEHPHERDRCLEKSPPPVAVNCDTLCKSIPFVGFTGGACAEIPEYCGRGVTGAKVGSAKCYCTGGPAWLEFLRPSPTPTPSDLTRGASSPCLAGVC